MDFEGTVSLSGTVVEKSVLSNTVILGSLLVALSYHYRTSCYVLDMVSGCVIWRCLGFVYDLSFGKH